MNIKEYYEKKRYVRPLTAGVIRFGQNRRIGSDSNTLVFSANNSSIEALSRIRSP